MSALTIGLDIAKNVFQVYGVDRGGRAVLQRKLRRADVLKFFSKPEPSLIGIARVTAHTSALANLPHMGTQYACCRRNM
jgi:transposase